jgi:2-haloacid dehalogenase
MRPTALVFDVNETLLDLSGLDAWFAETFGMADVRREWFALSLQAAMVSTITGRYETFADLAGACCVSLGQRRGRNVDLDGLRERMADLAPHPDVVPALAALRERGYRLAALSNNPLGQLRTQFGNAGLADLVEMVLSADEVRRLKPAPEPYHHAAERLGVGIGELMLVAAHGWDVAGAQAAGARGALVDRGGVMPFPVGPAPDLIVDGLAGLVTELT